jgi:hypothetical protein
MLGLSKMAIPKIAYVFDEDVGEITPAPPTRSDRLHHTA